MSTGGYQREHQRGHGPVLLLGCCLVPDANRLEALAFEISAQHPDWSLNYCELRAKVEHEKRTP